MGTTLISAAGEACVRITLLDACDLHGGLDWAPNDVQRRFNDSWVARGDIVLRSCGHSNRRTCESAPQCSFRAVHPDAIKAIGAWTIERGM